VKEAFVYSAAFICRSKLQKR